MTGPANTMRFNIVLDGVDLGSFTGMSGLTFQYAVKTYEEGGENGFIHQLPGRLSYGNITVTRSLDTQSKGLATWFGMLAKGIGSRRHTAAVVAFNDNGETVAEWTFVDVWPIRYTGPSLSTESGKVATETFEFAHNGLMG
jgi:phage tail-like protein